MTTDLDPHTDVPTPLSNAAEQVVQRLASDWDHTHDDLGRLLDTACVALAEEANHEIRQVLAQLGTELELLRSKLEGDASSLERLDRMLDGIDRASHVVGTYINRSEVAKLLIRIIPEPVDLADLLRGCLDRAGASAGQAETTLEPATIQGDRVKLATALGYLVDRFHRDAGPDQHLVVQLGANGDGVEGLIGLAPSQHAGDALIDELEAPLDIEAMNVDLPYARAVIERHGGTLYVDRFDPDGLGFGFRLPQKPPTKGA